MIKFIIDVNKSQNLDPQMLMVPNFINKRKNGKDIHFIISNY